MDFSLTDEQQAVKDLAAQILQPRAPEAEKAVFPPGGDGIDRDALRELADANLLGLCLGDDVGGSGYANTELAILLEEAGRALIRLPLVQHFAAARTIDAHGTGDLRQRVLPGAADGSALLTVATAEEGALEPDTVLTTAAADGDDIVLTGTKTAVAAAAQATSMLVTARDADGAVLLALVAPTADGVTLTALETSSGEAEHRVEFAGVRVASADIVARGSDGDAAFTHLLDQATLGVTARAVGIADKMLTMTATYVTNREQFGVPIGTFQGIAIRVANAFIDVQATRACLWQATWRMDNGLTVDTELPVAKFWASEAAERVATSCVHLHGGMGVDTDYPLHHYYLASKVNELTLGSASLTIDRLGRVLAATAGASA